MSEPISRRDALKQFVLLGGAAAALQATRPAQAADLPHLTTTDPTAAALKYHADAKTVDPKESPSYQAGQACNNCLQLQGSAGEQWRPCSVFPGKLVNANGWCSVWVKKV